MEIPEIRIPEIEVPFVYVPFTPTPIDTPAVIPGCSYQHRDQNLNPNLLLDDPNGVYATCPEGEIPHFWPMNYDKENITIIEEEPPTEQKQPPLPEAEEPKIPDIPTEEEDDPFVECPGVNDQRVGDFRNDKKLERVSGHRLSEDGKRCITEYESTNFVEQFIPSAPALANAAAIALVAASAPLLLNLVKPIVKNLVNKLTGKKKENDDEAKSD